MLLASAASARLVPVATELQQPVYVAAPAGDARLFIVERAGRIRVLDDGVVAATPFLDVRGRVDTEREGGLTGLAFPADYAETGRFFVYYTNGVPGVSDDEMEARISSFAAIGDPATSAVADADSEQVLFSVELPDTIHHGGTIAIRDGWLYLGLGDGAGSYDPFDHAQDDATPFGKLLRFDLAAALPEPEIWAKGLRNPFRLSFDRDTGDLWIGDVGQDAREEVNVEPASSAGGRNYGWDVMEGSLCIGPTGDEPPCADPSFTPPLHEYAHEGTCGGAVTGGNVYRGSLHPALAGAYLFADFCHGRIWSLRWDAENGLVEPAVDRTDALMPEGETLRRIVGFGEDASGELYVAAMNDFGTTGAVYRLPEPGLAAGPSAVGALVALGGRRCRRRA
ncbi:MAG: glucose dehydrogenase [Proteobacteria bacterium]|nr:MAG: glucose dehydrogenase [Pseudomonadota bacterium]